MSKKAYFQIHTAVLLFGLTAIIGKYIVFEELALVWYRMWIAVVGLLFVPKVIRDIIRMDRKDLLRFVFIGILVSLHWLAFFGSVKLGNVSVALACMATTALFIAFLEPMITRSKFNWFELLLGIFVIVGILLILQLGEAYYESILSGLAAAFLAALFSTLNKRYLRDHRPISVSTVELFSGFLFLTLVIPIWEGGFDFSEYSMFRDDLISEHALFGVYIHSGWYLLVLGLLCTSIGYALALASLKSLSAFSAALAVNLEPIYGIIMAILLFHENKELNTQFYVGSTLILLSVIIHPIMTRSIKRYRNKRVIPGG